MRYAIALSTVLLMTGAAHAQGGPGMDAGGPGMGPHAGMMGHAARGGSRGAGVMPLLRAADADRDGSASWQEVTALQAEDFAWRDRNGDGVLDTQDRGPLAQRLADLRPERPDDPWARPRRGARADADADGQVTRDEALARLQTAFAALDADGDGVVTAAEAQSARPERPRGPGGGR